MPAIPSVIIGLGTSGSEVAAQVYHKYQDYLKETGDKQDLVQFLMIDTDTPVEGVSARHILGVGVPGSGGERHRKAAWANNAFFRQWWDPDFTNIGPLHPGASTTPMKGRLAFWLKLARPHEEVNFSDVFRKCAENAVEASDREVVDLFVYLVTTLAGGTGAGIFLDVAQVIKSVPVQTQLFGLFLMPEVVQLKPVIKAFRHQHSANAYGCLIDLNYWQAEQSKRPIDIGPFMETKAQDYEGDDVPFDACWLVSRTNKVGRAMGTWEQYQNMCADSLASLVFGPRAEAIQGALNNPVDFCRIPLKKVSRYLSPCQYGSLATYSLNYRPDTALDYVGAHMAVAALDRFLAKAEDQSLLAEEPARGFLKDNQLREVDDDGNADACNEVTDNLRDFARAERKLYEPMVAVLNSLSLTGGRTVLISELTKPSVKRGKVKLAVERLRANVEAGLEGELKNKLGVNYRRIMQDNHQAFLAQAIGDLHGRVSHMITDPDVGFEAAVTFLRQVDMMLDQHWQSLEDELAGDLDRGIVGDRARLEGLESEDVFDPRVRNLERQMFARSLRPEDQKRDAIWQFERDWWRPWLLAKINIMVKDQANAFHQDLEDEVAKLLVILDSELRPSLEALKTERAGAKRSVYGQASGRQTAELEEPALTDGSTLAERFREPLVEAARAGREIVAGRVATDFENLASLSLKDYTAERKRQSRQTLTKDLGELIAEDAQTRFQPDLEAISLWEALALDSRRTDPGGLRQAIEQRVRQCKNRCVPFWQIDPEFGAREMILYQSVIHCYNEGSLEAFQDAHDIEGINIAPAAEARDASRAQIYGGVAHEPSPHQLTILMFEMGVPLAFIDDVTRCLASFEHQTRSTDRPCLRDHRLEQLIKLVGLPTWAIEPEAPIDECHYQLLMAEHFGDLDTPLVRRLRTSGTHRLTAALVGKDARTLGTSKRETAFDKLLPGGGFNSIVSDVLPDYVTQQTDRYNADEWIDHHLTCWARLHTVLEHIEGSGPDEILRLQIGIMSDTINTEFGIKPEHLNKVAKDRHILEQFE